MGKANKSLKAWVAFVKSVQKKYKLTYKDAIHKAKELKDKGADWMNKSFKSMKGGEGEEMLQGMSEESDSEMGEGMSETDGMGEEIIEGTSGDQSGGRRHGRKRRMTRKRRGSRSRSKSRSKGKGRSRSFRRSMSRRRAASKKASRSMGLVMGVA